MQSSRELVYMDFSASRYKGVVAFPYRHWIKRRIRTVHRVVIFVMSYLDIVGVSVDFCLHNFFVKCFPSPCQFTKYSIANLRPSLVIHTVFQLRSSTLSLFFRFHHFLSGFIVRGISRYA